MFDPEEARRGKPGLRRGRRLWTVVWLGFGVGGISLIVLPKWLASGEKVVKSDLIVEASYNTQPPKYEFAAEPVIVPKLESPEPAPVEQEAIAPVYVAPEVPAVQAAAPAMRAPAASQRPRPQRINYDVSQPKDAAQGDWFKDGRRPMLAKGCALRPGASLIPAVLNTVIESEIPGQVISTVSENVYDADGVGRLLIPQGTKLVGVYKSDLSLGSRRLGMVWTELTMPSGRQLALADSNGMDIAGSMGVGGTVTTNWGQVIATAALFSVFDVAQRAFVSDGSYQGDMAEAASNNFAKTGQQVVKQMLEQAVKIRIPAGTPIVASPGKTIRVC